MKRYVYSAVKLTAVVAARAYMGMLIGLVLLAGAPLLIQWQPTIVTSGSMEPNVMTGDIIAAEPISQDELRQGKVTVGQVLLADNPAQPGHLYTHRVQQILPDNKGYVTKGDANFKADASPLPMKNVVGVERLRVPYLGMPIQKLRTGDPVPAIIFGIITFLAQMIVMKDNKAAKLARKNKDKDDSDTDNATPRPKSGRRRAEPKHQTNFLKVSSLTAFLIAVAVPFAGSEAAFSGFTAPPDSGFSSSATFPMPAVKAASLRFGLAEPGGLNDVDAEARNVNEYPSIVETYTDFTKSFDMSTTNAIIAKGALPVITWEPFVTGGGVNQPSYKLSTIISGAHDAYISSVADQLVSAGNPTVAIRFAHEMNANWFPWSEQVNGNVAGEYIQAWKHVVDIFRAKGLTNVQWVWSPNVPYAGSTDLTGLYPGTGYVTTTAIDGYNFGTTIANSAWASPTSVFSAGLSALQSVAPDKNIIVAETGSVDTEGANTKEQWITDMVNYLNHWGDAKPIKVTGFIWFDQTNGSNMRIDTTTASSTAMRNALAAR